MCKFCEGQCACHINPPCSFRESHIECEMCGQQVCADKTEEVTDNSDGSKLLICPDCYDAEVD